MKKTRARRPFPVSGISSVPTQKQPASPIGNHLVGLLGLLSLLAAIGLAASRPVSSVTGAPVPVQVSNTASIPVRSIDLDTSARQPFSIRVFPAPTTSASFTVPAGKRLVITQVSGFTPSPTIFDMEIGTRVGGTNGTLRIPFSTQVSTLRYATQQITDYADPGTTVFVGVDDGDLSDASGINIDINGYYVNLP